MCILVAGASCTKPTVLEWKLNRWKCLHSRTRVSLTRESGLWGIERRGEARCGGMKNSVEPQVYSLG